MPDDPYLARELFRYFPEPMRERFADEIEAHRLRREIIATQLANSLINRGGPTLLVAARDRTGASVAELTRAYAAVRDSFGLQELHAEIDALDAKISGRLQLELYAIVQDVLVDRLGWFTRNLEPDAGLAEIVAHYRAALAELAAVLPSLLPRETVEGGARHGAAAEAGPRAGGRSRRGWRCCRRWRAPRTSSRSPTAPAGASPRRRRPIFAVSDRFGFGRIDRDDRRRSRPATITRAWRCRRRATAWRPRTATWRRR